MFESLVSLLRPWWFRGKYRLFTHVVPTEGEREATVFGYRMRLDLADFIQRGVFIGAYEPDEIARVRELLQPGMTFLDCGANVGFFTLLASRLVGPTGRVIAVEPSPYAVGRLRETVRNNGITNVTVVHAGLGERRGTLQLMVPKAVGNHAPSFVPGNENTAPVDVQVVTVDELLDEQKVATVDLMKVDVEGFEPALFRGAERSARAGRLRQVLCEFNDPALRRGGSSPDALHAQLRGFGFVDQEGEPVFEPGGWPNRHLAWMPSMGASSPGASRSAGQSAG